MIKAAQLYQYQPYLVKLAYNVLGSIKDAEDVVQDAYLKLLESVDFNKIKDLKAYLSRIVLNASINHLKSFKVKNFSTLDYLSTKEIWESCLEFKNKDFDFEKEFQQALSILQEKLEPIERAIFTFKEGFDFDYEQLTVMFDKKADNCRKILSRAKKKLQEVDFTTDFENKTKNAFSSIKFANKVKNASSTGFTYELSKYLKENLKK